MKNFYWWPYWRKISFINLMYLVCLICIAQYSTKWKTFIDDPAVIKFPCTKLSLSEIASLLSRVSTAYQTAEQVGCSTACLFSCCVTTDGGRRSGFLFIFFVSVATRSQARSVLLIEAEELLWAMASGVALPHHPQPPSDNQSVRPSPQMLHLSPSYRDFLFLVLPKCIMFRVIN